MPKQLWKFLLSEEIRQNWREVNQENRLAIRLLALAGLPLSVINIFAQWIISGNPALSAKTVLMVAFFLVMLLLDRLVLPKDCPCATAVIYILEIPVMLLGICLGTIWDPNHQAVTFLLLILALPVFILDRPIRLLGITLFWTTVFLAVSSQTKDPDCIRSDHIHAIEFFLASVMVTSVVLRVRMESLRNLTQTRHLLQHDALTGALNRFALEMRTEDLLGRSLVILVGDLDQLNLFNDFYGRQIGDQMLIRFVQSMSESFGEDQVFRYGGDELLCVAEDMAPEDCLRLVEECRARLDEGDYEGQVIHATCSFGYVTGVPDSIQTFQEMVHLATIYAHMAKKQGRSKTVGKPFNQKNLRQGITDSNIVTHAQDYETNQLTGLPSMSYFIARGDELLTRVVELDKRPMVGFFNLIQFRFFNDEFGYEQGDRLIHDTAEMLREAFPHRNLGYITGSQFALMCYESEIAPAMEQIQNALSAYKQGFPIRCKAGFSEYTGDQKAISLLDQAKLAHDSIHNIDRTYRIYDADLEGESRFRQYIISHLDEALEKGWIKIYLQPIVRSITGHVCNEEALSRWDDPVYGFLTPAQFIPVLEENRLLYKLSLYVIRQVAEYLRRRAEKGMVPLPVSVNLSRYDFESCDMAEEISRIAAQAGVEPWLLKLEITETAFIENQALLQREIERLQKQGFQVWMDDFGSGYSALNLLSSLKFDTVKLDMQFLRGFSDSRRNQIVVREIIEMAKQLGIMTLVEGVEQEEHFRMLRDMGCEKLQGFLFSRPVPMESVFDRFDAGEDLRCEPHGEGMYYEEVLRFELNAPLRSRDPDAPFFLDNEQPVGVLELEQDRLSCIRATGRFTRLLEAADLLPERQEDDFRQRLADPPPRELLEAARLCTGTDRWISGTLTLTQGRRITFYLQRIVAKPDTGAVAMLAAMLPGPPEDAEMLF